MKELEKLLKREDAGELTVYPITVFFHTDEIIEVCWFTAHNSVVLLASPFFFQLMVQASWNLSQKDLQIKLH